RRRGRSQGRWSLRTGNDSPFPVSGLLDLIECAGDPSGSARPRTGRAGRSIPGEPGEKERKDEDTPQAKARGSAHRALPRIGDGHTSGAAPEGSGSDGGPPAPEVLRRKYDSYVVVMKTDPLIVTEGQDNLRSQRARNRGQQMKAQHARTMRDVGLSPDRITTEYTNALNGFAARIGYQDAVKLAAHPE